MQLKCFGFFLYCTTEWVLVMFGAPPRTHRRGRAPTWTTRRPFLSFPSVQSGLRRTMKMSAPHALHAALSPPASFNLLVPLWACYCERSALRPPSRYWGTEHGPKHLRSQVRAWAHFLSNAERNWQRRRHAALTVPVSGGHCRSPYKKIKQACTRDPDGLAWCFSPAVFCLVVVCQGRCLQPLDRNKKLHSTCAPSETLPPPGAVSPSTGRHVEVISG